MEEPKTLGILQTDLSEMQVGDYITCYYRAEKGSVGEFYGLGEDFDIGIPLEGSEAPEGQFYFIKVARGLLVADRVVQHSISWETLNSEGCIEGTPKVIGKSLVEPLTSADSPEPFKVLASSEYNSSYEGWKVFSRTTVDSYDCWMTHATTPTGWLQIDLGEPKVMNFFTLTARNYSNITNTAPKDFSILGSNDGENFTTLGSFSNITGWLFFVPNEFYLDNDIAYRFYRIQIDANNGGAFSTIGRWDLYYVPQYKIRSIRSARMANKVVGPMTSNTTPAPFEITASSSYNTTYPAWKAFNGTNDSETDCWITANNVTSGWLTVYLGRPEVVTGFLISMRKSSYRGSPQRFSLLGSNDGENFEVLGDFLEDTEWASGEDRYFSINNDRPFSYYRLNIDSVIPGSASYVSIARFEILSDSMEVFPPRNEWQDLIINFPKDLILPGFSIRDIFNLETFSWTQETPFITIPSATSGMRNIVGDASLGEVISTQVRPNLGFRPVLEYKEV